MHGRAALPARAKETGAARQGLAGRLVSLRTLALLIAALLGALIIYPIGTMILRAFFAPTAVGDEGIIKALADTGFMPVLVNTLVVVGLSGTLALVVGATFAWLNERTDASTGWIGGLLPLVPLLVPQIAGVAGWVMLLAPQAGIVNGLLRDGLAFIGLPMRTGPVNIYSFGGFVAIMALYMVPYVYLTVSAALQNLDPHLEEASRLCRAGAFTTLRRVTLPAIRPALMASVLLLIMMGFAIFSVPVVIGSGAHIELLSVKIYRLIYTYPPRTDLAILLGLFLTFVVQSALLLQAWVASLNRAATIGGKGLRAATTKLGPWRFVARAVMIIYLLAAAVLPVVGLAIVSLQPFWSARINFSVLDFQNYVTVLVENDITRRALFNSVVLGIVGGTIGMLIAAILVVTAKSERRWFGRAVDVITATPAGIPHVVIGVGFVLCFSSGWLNLSGGFLILILAYLVMNMPQAMRSAAAAVDQVGRELLEASQVFRASQGRTFRRILLPLMLPSLGAGWIILFVQMSGELTASALLAGTTNPVVGQVILDFWQNGSFPQIAALAMTMTLINAVVVVAALRLARGRAR
ncbi:MULTISPECIES: iron ABC transporter permease [unclassified Chelatococcus]|uniref:ABC transporter permease n=1 Tax=unclassified Chelatococcus TaxID=2638111 RepID=UPI001BD15232|nr:MULTISPECIES: iron ABC transporter permease [unclassified Chelatococcus]MBS7700745.1 iron ABC transporter permease [Chelatococcus sp. YT9]